MSEVELKKLFQIEDILSLPNAIFKIIFDNVRGEKRSVSICGRPKNG